MGAVADRLRRALAPASSVTVPVGGVPAAVLLPLYEDPEPTLVLTKRSQSVRTHKGEVSFPGGGRNGDESLVDTALRETEEELAVPAEAVEILGTLPPTPTFVSGFVIVPFVGLLAERPVFAPSPLEIDEVLELSLRELMAAERMVEHETPAGRFPMYVYEAGGQTVWGATGRILHTLLETLREGGLA